MLAAGACQHSTARQYPVLSLAVSRKPFYQVGFAAHDVDCVHHGYQARQSNDNVCLPIMLVASHDVALHMLLSCSLHLPPDTPCALFDLTGTCEGTGECFRCLQSVRQPVADVVCRLLCNCLPKKAVVASWDSAR